MAQCDQAIAKLPNDPLLHEFRGLTLFALHRYKEAAGTIYAVLSVGPGWDWTTLASLYPDIDVYTQQLRDLEQYVNAHRDEAERAVPAGVPVLDLRAYRRGRGAVQGGGGTEPERPVVGPASGHADHYRGPRQTAPSAPAKPVEAAALAGQWTARRADGATIALNLAKDDKYTWNFAEHDKPQAFSGDYAVADNLLILKKGNAPVMIGQVTMLADDRFNFKLPGDNPSDPGLTFSR